MSYRAEDIQVGMKINSPGTTEEDVYVVDKIENNRAYICKGELDVIVGNPLTSNLAEWINAGKYYEVKGSYSKSKYGWSI